MNSPDVNGNKNIISVLADEDTVTGFRLAGVQNAAAVNLEAGNSLEQIREAVDRLLKLYGTNASGLLIVTEAVYEFMQKNGLLKKFGSYPEITLVQVPDKSGSKGIAKQKLARLFEEAIGVAMKK